MKHKIEDHPGKGRVRKGEIGNSNELGPKRQRNRAGERHRKNCPDATIETRGKALSQGGEKGGENEALLTSRA